MVDVVLCLVLCFSLIMGVVVEGEVEWDGLELFDHDGMMVRIPSEIQCNWLKKH